MRPRIAVLDEALVNQIAAGEVIERPANVAKELVENALDAGARTITVEVEAGGIGLLRVTDDGHGMGEAEALLSVQRHATSKIRAFDDLSRLETLGFRGEALPSIASVARFRLTTRAPDSVIGTSIRIDGGEQPISEPIGCAPGTTVEVRDLFFNVPARRKFLKRATTESSLVVDVCVRAALAHPNLRLIVIRDGRRTRELLPSEKPIDRARALINESLSEIRARRGELSVVAALGAPERARSGARDLHVLVNGRPVRDRAIARAVAFAYGSLLPPGRYPSGVVWLELPKDQVDVNVHPQKAEVRFSDAKQVLDAITRALAGELGTKAWGHRGSSPVRAYRNEPPAIGRAEESTQDPWGLASRLGLPASASVLDVTRPTAGDDNDEQRSLFLAFADGVPSPTAEDASLPADRGYFGQMRVLAQVRRMLIVCEGPDGLHIIDQHAADERVRFNRLRAQYRSGAVSRQRLLFPERVECTDSEAELIQSSREELETLGLECSLLGDRTVAVRAVPALVKRAAPERLIRDVLVELSHSGERAFGDAVDMALATMACHGAIRAGDELAKEECQALLLAMDEAGEFGGHCPHGRPVVFSIGWGELERRLGR